MFYVTWQPSVAEPGHYFLTFVEGDPDTPVWSIMTKAHESEDLDIDEFEVCSIIYVSPDAHDGETQVIC
jgi:hypothetical protein